MALVENWRPEDEFALRLRMMRARLGLSVEEISARCGVKMATWSSWERGTAPRGMNRIVERIAAATGVDRDWLMWGGSLWPPSTKWLIPSAPSASSAAAA